jgi:hypothetical protein
VRGVCRTAAAFRFQLRQTGANPLAHARISQQFIKRRPFARFSAQAAATVQIREDQKAYVIAILSGDDNVLRDRR